MPTKSRCGSDHSNYVSLEVCGVSTAALIFAIGVACFVISVVGMFDESAVECGKDGKPPLNSWILGTGIAFSIISFSFWRVGSGKGGRLSKWILGISNLFVVVWALLGVLSMLKFEGDCRDSSPMLWNMAWAAVGASFLVCCCGGFVGYNVPTAEAEVVSEEEEEEEP